MIPRHLASQGYRILRLNPRCGEIRQLAAEAGLSVGTGMCIGVLHAPLGLGPWLAAKVTSAEVERRSRERMPTPEDHTLQPCRRSWPGTSRGSPQPDETICRGHLTVSAQALARTCGQRGRPPHLLRLDMLTMKRSSVMRVRRAVVALGASIVDAKGYSGPREPS